MTRVHVCVKQKNGLRSPFHPFWYGDDRSHDNHRQCSARCVLLDVPITMTAKPLKNMLKIRHAMSNWTQE